MVYDSHSYKSGIEQFHVMAEVRGVCSLKNTEKWFTTHEWNIYL